MQSVMIGERTKRSACAMHAPALICPGPVCCKMRWRRSWNRVESSRLSPWTSDRPGDHAPIRFSSTDTDTECTEKGKLDDASSAQEWPRRNKMRIAYLTLEIMNLAYLTSKFRNLPICPQLKFFFIYLTLL